MMFKKTIFVTLFSLLTAGAFNQAQAQSAQQLGQWLGAAAGGAIGYNNGGSDRGARTAGGAILGALVGNFIGKSIDESNARSMGYYMNSCANHGESTCSWSSSDGSYTVEARKVLIKNRQCYRLQTYVMTSEGPKNCVCYTDEQWVTVQDEYSDFDNRQAEKDALEQRILSRERIIKNGGRYGHGGNSGRMSDAELDAISRRNDRILGNGSSSSTTSLTRITETTRTSEVAGVDSLLRLSDGRMCPVTDAFKDAQFGYMDDVCRQNIGANTREEALALCQHNSPNPSTCASK